MKESIRVFGFTVSTNSARIVGVVAGLDMVCVGGGRSLYAEGGSTSGVTAVCGLLLAILHIVILMPGQSSE